MRALRDISEIERIRAWGPVDVLLMERKFRTRSILAWGTTCLVSPLIDVKPQLKNGMFLQGR